MSKERSEFQNIDQFIVLTINKNRPSTVEQLVKLVQAEYSMSEQKIIERILQMQDQGKIVFEENSSSPTPLLKSYIFSSTSNWYWTIIVISIVTLALVFIIPENAYPTVYARYILGSIFVLLLPGYSLIKALFPTKELDNIERIALSIGMSLALVPITGLLLNYTPLGIRIAPITLSLLVLTMVFATTALVRKCRAQIPHVHHA